MRLVCISDTHSLQDAMPPIPEGDVLIHAGDCTGSGSLPQTDAFTKWMGAQPHARKILIAGNHDFCFDKNLRDPAWSAWSRNMCEQNGITYLCGESVSVEGIKFFGFPWQPIYRHMAFNASEDELEERLKLVPADTHVLISHGPALRIFDYIPDERMHVGSHALAQRIDQLTHLKAHICGHIHESYGFAVRESDGVKFANASTCNARYKPVNPPIIIDL
ncbi:metallophosphatase domain-containing protein [Marinobacter halotolerans]|uniref:metallophosphatase domain-containing protein n=1 Tax=Marinobacter halotolerans TaxID=1569211 RepID=UPI0012465677|nr:metallophosphatase domain-containing protein [Marinobacter halotolerans]